MMKIIRKDNFDREYVDDLVIAENIDKIYGKVIVDFLNKKFSGPTASIFFFLAPNDYKPYKFEH